MAFGSHRPTNTSIADQSELLTEGSTALSSNATHVSDENHLKNKGYGHPAVEEAITLSPQPPSTTHYVGMCNNNNTVTVEWLIDKHFK